MTLGTAPVRVRIESGANSVERATVERFSGALKRAATSGSDAAPAGPSETAAPAAKPERGGASEADVNLKEAQEPGAAAQEGPQGAQESARRDSESQAREARDQEAEPEQGESVAAGATEEGAGAEPSASVATPERAARPGVVSAETVVGTEAHPSAIVAGSAPEAEPAAESAPISGRAATQSAAGLVESDAKPVTSRTQPEARSEVRVTVDAGGSRESARVKVDGGHDIPEPEAPRASTGSHVEAETIGAEESREIRRIAAQAEARAWRPEPAGEVAGRERAAGADVLERAEGRMALERLIDAGRVTEPRVDRAPDAARTSAPDAAAAVAGKDGGAAAIQASMAGQGGQEQRGESRAREARPAIAPAPTPKPDAATEPSGGAKPSADAPATIGLTNVGVTKGARDAGKPGATATTSAGHGANVEAAASRGLMAAVQQKGGTVTVRLEPETLGSMRVRMELSGGVVRATFEVTTPEARDLLGSRLDALRSSLEAKGLGVERLQVQLTSAGQGGSAGNDSSSGEGRWQGSRSSPDAGEGKTRGDAGGGRERQDGAPQDRRGSPEFAGALGGAWREEWVRIGVDALV